MAEITKTNPNISGWMRRFLFSLGKHKETSGILSEKQLDVVYKRFVELGNSLEEVVRYFETEKIKPKSASLPPHEPNIENKKVLTFNKIKEKALKDGFIEVKEVEDIDYDMESDILDYFEAIEELEGLGVKILY